MIHSMRASLPRSAGPVAQAGPDMTIDTTSPPGSWERELDFKRTTPAEMRADILEMRKRIRAYLNEIEQLRARVRELEARESAWVREP